jgi:hypothetical protein
MSSPSTNDEALAQVGAVCLGGPDALAALPDARSVEAVLGLLERHGLFLALPPSVAALLGPDTSRQWRDRFLREFARSTLLLRQVRDIAEACAAEGAEVMPLKGAAALATLYPSYLQRFSCDLDLLVREEQLPALRRVMSALGYRPSVTSASPEEAALRARDLHLDPYVHDDRAIVELHVTFLKGRGDGAAARDDAWRDARTSTIDGALVRELAPELFILHSATHYAGHLQRSPASLKGLLDMALAIRHHGPALDWDRFWHAAARWRVTDDATAVTATLNRYWRFEIPLRLPQAEPYSADLVLYGPTPGPDEEHAWSAQDYAERVTAIRDVPGWAGRARYLFRLAFPPPEILRRSYGLPQARSVAPYYFLYPASRLARFVHSAWHTRFRRR